MAAPVGVRFAIVGAPLVLLLAPDVLTATVVAAVVVVGVIGAPWSVPLRRSAVLDRMLLAGIGLALAAVLSLVANPVGPGGIVAVGRFLLVPLGFAVLRRSVVHDLRGAIWLSAVIGSIVAGTVAVGVLVLVQAGRPTSFVNPIQFGELALLLGFTATITRGMAPWGRRVVRRATLVAVASAVTASVLAQSRGSWLALPVIVGVALVHHHRSGEYRPLRYAAALVALVVPVMILAGSANGAAAARALDRGIEQTVEYVATDGAAPTGETSVGARFEMWRSALAGFRSSPLLGIGWGNMDERFAQDVDAGVRAERIAEHRHPHNQYVSHLGSGGVLGLASLLALFVVPAQAFARAARRRDDADRRALGSTGLAVLAGFSVFAMTDSVFESVPPLVFFVCAVGVVVGQLDRLDSEHTFAYGGGHGMEQPAGSVARHRAHPL